MPYTGFYCSVVKTVDVSIRYNINTHNIDTIGVGRNILISRAY